MNLERKTLYDLLPAYVRRRDQESGRALEQLLSLLDAQAQAVERDLERMYDNWFIETCDPWVVPYIADLLGHPPPPSATASASLARIVAPRAEIAHAIAHGRRKGTLALLASLAWDIARWPAYAVEFRRLLVGAQHLDHLQPARHGTLDLRDGAALARIGSPFDSSCRLVDTHRIADPVSRGTHNLPNVGLFVFRMRHYQVDDTWAYCQEEAGAHCYSFSLLGNDAPLYRPGDATMPPLPIGRGALEDGRDGDVRPAQAAPDLVGHDRALSIVAMGWPRKDVDTIVKADAIIPADLDGWSYRVPKGKVAVDPVRGRLMFAAGQAPRKGVRVRYGYGAPMDLGGGQYDRPPLPLPADVERATVRASEFIAQHGKPAEGEYAGIAAAIEAWQRRRAAAAQPMEPPAGEAVPEKPVCHPALVVTLADSGVYRGRLELSLGSGESVWLIAAPGTRPVVWLSDDNAGGPDSIAVRGAAGSRFVLEGVMVAGRGITLSAWQGEHAERPEGESAKDGDKARTPEDDLCSVLIRHSTLVPGWGLDCDCGPRRASEPSIVADGSRTCLRIEHSIVGALRARSEDGDAPPATWVVSDSVVDANAVKKGAIGDGNGGMAPVQLKIERSTVVGAVAVHALLRAEDSLLLGQVRVARRQLGCVRYSYVPDGSRTPRRHRCQPDDAIRAAVAAVAADAAIDDAERPLRRAQARQEALARTRPVFESMRYGTPAYLRLRACCAPEIARGAHDASGMGVHHDLYEPQRIGLLEARVADHVPAGFESCVLLAS